MLEDQVRQLHRVKTMADLLGGVAHDLSSALTGIVWCTEAVRARLSAQDADLGAGLGDFVNAADYARKLARRLISIGRQRDGQFAACRIQDVVAETAALLETLRPRSVQLCVRLDAEEAWVIANADQLQQVLVNLATNAFDATSVAGGSVEITLEQCGVPPEGTVVLSVTDTGPGMSEETLERAFEPFFTTKGGHDGNGLGLVVVKSIVHGHGGELHAKSVLGEGTQMVIHLPLAEPQADHAS